MKESTDTYQGLSPKKKTRNQVLSGATADFNVTSQDGHDVNKLQMLSSEHDGDMNFSDDQTEKANVLSPKSF